MSLPFADLADEIVDDLLAASPSRAMGAGDHRHDHRLDDFSDDAVRREVEMLRRRSGELAAVDTTGLSVQDDVDRQLLAGEVEGQLFALTSIDERTWNPLVHNPAGLLFGLLAREIGPADERLKNVAARLDAIPDALATAERVLGECSRVHVETAISQLAGTTALVRTEVPALVARAPSLRGIVEPVRLTALAALERHATFLAGLLDGAARDPRLGRQLWETRLRHTLDSEFSAGELMTRAEADLDRVTEQITTAAIELTGNDDVLAALDRLAQARPDDSTIMAKAERALCAATDFVTEHELVTVLADPVEIVPMPEHARGVAVAYCDAPGPLETRVVPTFYAISPTPVGWSPERVQSFYREYNDHMLHNLTVHEAMPGHFLQLAHARRFRGSTRARAICQSGSFIEGWAVYAEELMVEQGFGGLPVRMQQLKLQLRMIINAIIDQRVHCDGMSESDAMTLMTRRGFQEEGEAAGKWRRALLTSTQLSTYYVGYTEVAQIVARRPAEVSGRHWHDAMLAHGSPAPRHLRTLLDV